MFTILTFALSVSCVFSQNKFPDNEIINPRVRVIIDNDFGGDPDGLFQLAHHILSPTVEVKAIIGSIHYKNGFYGLSGTAAFACERVNELLNVMQLDGKLPVYEGGNSSLTDMQTPVVSEGAKAIVREAMREDTKLPLYVVCGAGLTDIASAYLIEPKIANKITLVWIGGAEYADLAFVPKQAGSAVEYNLGIDGKAAQVVFNVSDIPIWQVPRDVYRQALYSYSELICRVKTNGLAGKYLVEKLEDLMQRSKGSLGEAYVLGDSPLVLLTALQSSWENDPSSSKYTIKSAPKINDKGTYEENPQGRKIRIYTCLDTRLMFEDFLAKLTLLKNK
jgi:inosine-uridine nucleoside N-ribohydrolase